MLPPGWTCVGSIREMAPERIAVCIDDARTALVLECETFYTDISLLITAAEVPQLLYLLQVAFQQMRAAKAGR